MQNPNQQFEQEFKERLSEMQFPADAIHPDFGKWLKAALRHESGASLNCSVEILEALHTKDPFDFNYFEISFAVNSIQAKSPHALDVSGSQYVSIMHYVEEMGKIWHSHTDQIRINIARKIQTQQHIKNGTPINKRIAIGKPGKA